MVGAFRVWGAKDRDRGKRWRHRGVALLFPVLAVTAASFVLAGPALAAGVTISCSPSCSAPAGQPISFTATVISDGSTPSSVNWDFNGDGLYDQSQGNPVNWTFEKPGPYTVEAQAIDCSTGPCVTYTGSQSVTATPPPPLVTTGTAKPGLTAAELTGTVDPNGYLVEKCYFDYGTSALYGKKVPCAQDLSTATSPTPVSAEVSGLTPNTIYHYRLVASNTNGSADGSDRTFRTASPINAAVSVTTHPPLHTGGLITFASSSTVAAGYHVFAYRWDFNDDGRWDSDTGVYGTASHRFATAGSHTIRMEVEATNSSGQVSTSTTTTHVNTQTLGATVGCDLNPQTGWLDFLTTCIKNDNGKYEMNLDGGVGLAGLELTSAQSGAKLVLDTTGSNANHDNPDHKWALRSTAPVTISILNGEDGTIGLGTLDLQNHPVLLPVGADAPDQNAPGLRIFSLNASSTCHPHPGVPPVVCFQLPGHFPIEGSASAYVTGGVHGESPGGALQANIHILPPVDVTAGVTLTGDASGLHMDSFSFGLPSFNIGTLATVDPITLNYQRHDDDTNQNDVYVASGGVRFHVAASPGITVSVRFADGGFREAHFDLHGHLVLGPVTLTELGATLGVEPFKIGGNLAGSIGPYGLSAGVLYTEAWNGQPWHFQLGVADPDHNPDHIAPLFVDYPSVNPILKIGGSLDVYGDGFISGGVNVQFGLPNVNADHPNLLVEGYVRGWFAPPSAGVPEDSYQISGGVEVDAHALIHLYGSVQGFINNYWNSGTHYNVAAGCGQITADIGPWQPSVGGWVRVDLLHDDHVDDGIVWSGDPCANITGYCAPASVTGSHSVPPCIGFAADTARVRARLSSAAQRFWIPAGMNTENLRLVSTTGLPQVQISGPSGTYTTPAGPQTAGQKPTFISGGFAAQHQVDIAILNPRPGAYTITPVAGSPAIAQVLESHPLPAPKLRVRITGRGAHRRLHFSLRAERGQRVVFIEHAADVSHTIGSSAAASGTIRFRPQAAYTRARTIEADLFENGQAEKPVVVAHYRAPAPAPARPPAHVYLRRHHNRLRVSWSASRGATGYQVWVIGSDGRHSMYVTASRVRHLTVAPVFPEVSLRVRVSTIGGPFHLAGRAKTVRLRRVAR